MVSRIRPVSSPASSRPNEIVDVAGSFANPEELAYGRDGKPEIPLYRVQFRQTDLWPDYKGEKHDTAVADIFEHWLEPVT